MEKKQLALIVVCKDVEPPTLVQHLPIQARLAGVPICSIKRKDSSRKLGCLFGCKHVAAIGVFVTEPLKLERAAEPGTDAEKAQQPQRMPQGQAFHSPKEADKLLSQKDNVQSVHCSLQQQHQHLHQRQNVIKDHTINCSDHKHQPQPPQLQPQQQKHQKCQQQQQQQQQCPIQEQQDVIEQSCAIERCLYKLQGFCSAIDLPWYRGSEYQKPIIVTH